MTQARLAYIETATALKELPDFVADVGQASGLLKIKVTTTGPSCDLCEDIDRWFRRSISFPTVRKGQPDVGLPVFRGIDAKGLERALSNGIDVAPTDHHWFGSDLAKALEYGGDYPNVLIMDVKRIERTYRYLRVDAPQDEHEIARRFAGSEPIRSRDGTRLLYSRIPTTDSRRGSAYELEFAFYIPGNAKDALIGYIECAPA